MTATVAEAHSLNSIGFDETITLTCTCGEHIYPPAGSSSADIAWMFDRHVKFANMTPDELAAFTIQDLKDSGCSCVWVVSDRPPIVTLRAFDMECKNHDPADHLGEPLVHSHGTGKHAHAHGEIPHTHFLRAVCLLPECADFPTHDIHPRPVPDGA